MSTECFHRMVPPHGNPEDVCSRCDKTRAELVADWPRPAKVRRFGFRRAIALWWTLRSIVKLARRPMPESTLTRCTLCGHARGLHDWRGCVQHDEAGPCLCPRGPQ